VEVRYSVHPEHAKTFDTEKLRKEFLINDLFVPGKIKLVYSYSDRVIVGGALPLDEPISLEGGKEIAADHFLQRREMGIINVGDSGMVEAGGESYTLGFRDGLYLGPTATAISFYSKQKKQPAKFYMVSAPAFQSNPSRMVSLKPLPAGILTDRYALSVIILKGVGSVIS